MKVGGKCCFSKIATFRSSCAKCSIIQFENFHVFFTITWVYGTKYVGLLHLHLCWNSKYDITNPYMTIKTTMFTHRPRVSLIQFSFCWWRHNQLLMTSQWPHNCDAIAWIMIFNSLEIDFIHGDIHGRSCKNITHCILIILGNVQENVFAFTVYIVYWFFPFLVIPVSPWDIHWYALTVLRQQRNCRCPGAK